MPLASPGSVISQGYGGPLVISQGYAPEEESADPHVSQGLDLAEVISSARFEIQERGGFGGASCEFLAGWEDLDLAGTERVDIWLWDEPRYRGYVRVPERRMDSPETASLTIYGMVALLDSWQVRRKIARGCPMDLTEIFTALIEEYVQVSGRFPDVTVDASTPIGVTLSEFDARGKSVAQAINSLCDLAPEQVIWGHALDAVRPVPGDILYMRPKPTTPAYVVAVGDNVKSLVYPVDSHDIVNSLAPFTGGTVEQPNLAVNGSFENVLPASDSAGNLLLNASFESGSTSWVLSGGATVQFQGNGGAHGSAKDGAKWLELDTSSEWAYQDVAIIPGRAYTASVWARQERIDYPNSGLLILEGYDASNTLVTTIYQAMHVTSTPVKLDSETYRRFTTSLDLAGYPTVVKLRYRLESQSGAASNDGVLFDFCGLYESCAAAQELWRAVPTGAAVIDDMDWASLGTPAARARSGKVCVRVKASGIAVTADTVEIYVPAGQALPVSPDERYTLSGWWHVDGVGSSGDSGITICATAIKSDGSVGITWESDLSVGNPSTWKMARVDVPTESDTAKLQIYFRIRTNREIWLDDVMLVQGELPEEVETQGGYWTGSEYQRAIDVEDPLLTGMLEAGVADSIADYGEHEVSESNSMVTDIATFLAYAAGKFNARALPKIAGTLEVFGAREVIGQDGKVRLINLPDPPPALWPARTMVTINADGISTTTELGNARADLAALLLLTADRARKGLT
jgi:hypothetical protein